MRFRWFHANVKSNPKMPADKVVFDVIRIKRLAKNGGFNEIAPAYYKSIVDKVFGRVYNLDTESPQVLNPKLFRVIRSYSVKTHGGFLKLTPTRKVCVTLAETVKGHIPVGFVESHYVNKGMHIPRAKRKTEFRQKLHLRHFNTEAGIVNKLVEAGFTVFGAEDTNKVHQAKYHPNQVWVHNEGIDKMWYVPASNVNVYVVHKEVVTDTHTFLNTDHPALFAVVDLRWKEDV